jgi:hypothetical protein
MKTKKQMQDYAQGFATDFFFADDDEVWEPFEHWDDDRVKEERDKLAGYIYHAMLWAQGDQTHDK